LTRKPVEAYRLVGPDHAKDQEERLGSYVAAAIYNLSLLLLWYDRLEKMKTTNERDEDEGQVCLAATRERDMNGSEDVRGVV